VKKNEEGRREDRRRGRNKVKQGRETRLKENKKRK
jgi:hypothetical protein